MRIGVFLFLFVDMVNISMNAIPCRQQIVSLYFAKAKKQPGNLLMTLSVLIPAFAIIIFYPDIMGLFGLCGGIFCTLIGWTVPYLIMIRINSKFTNRLLINLF